MKKAFTIIELIVVIVILGIIAGLGIEIIKFSYDNEQRVRALNELELKSQATMDFLTTHLNNAIKNSFRLKKAENSECVNSVTDCKFVFNIEDDSLKNDFKIFEWARIAIIDKKHNKWDGLNETKSVVHAAVNDKASCYDGTNYFNCFSHKQKGINTKIINSYSLGDKLGVYFLGDNIATSTSFMEKDLYDLEIAERNVGSGKKEDYAKIELKLSDKIFTISNVYVLVDKIEGIKFEDGELKYYSYDFKDKKPNFATNTIDKVTLVNNVSDFIISNNNGVTKIKLCLEVNDLPGSFITKKTSLKVCKSGVII
ncbi:prepilin-type N-terminal cleavage/methylation domain-containing protein [Campylobacter sp. RM12640]|uniref:prepilin-type N-terminal cleavage/methylation domain-containing protein n=1 Tax=unclassified Campylobacter TaxID=2593542 RepID=UPI001D9F0429|nr:prepilin-type N-terminal cleavage/methylation domain-containing protein [Campylobacter sp. RM12642]MBZ7981164.1 prepilin-type N-terminal cleavage/methylation domain-containing protein [Campylobacter sp. RM12640]MBZ7988723.1 prepilin-type N-terminal cleavage/methylation domain-containing protein [Campylobacter sp. RM12635]MBZ8006924.1 prepilin-type N-terminal cleavage/methylation domain-containing protein [Campylobacter sp. RM9334]